MKFKQGLFLFNTFLQSALHQKLAKKIEARTKVTFLRELFKYDDGGLIAIDWASDTPKSDETNPLLVLMPGIGGDNNFAYIISLVEEA